MVKTIGILGGMGPFATIDLFQKIVSNTSFFTNWFVVFTIEKTIE
ncbi:hypothetical protein [Lederbergia citrea]|nr:hypothetical protein [Lederbergia citrea]